MGKKVKAKYPAWVCTECAEANGGRMPEGHVATWHLDICGWCGKTKGVTELRDFKYPSYSISVKM